MPTDGRTPSTGCISTALAILAMVVALPFVIGALTDDGGDGDENAAPAPEVATTTAPPAQDAEPVDVSTDVEDYTVTYRVEIFSGDAVLVDTEVRTYSSPFEAEVRVSDGEPGSADATLHERTTQVAGGFETVSADQEPLVFAVVPGIPAQLGHVAGDLDAAQDHGLIEALGRRLRIADTDCDDYRTRSSVDAPVFETPTAEEFTDVCIAPDGLVLREEQHRAGEVVRRRTAVDIDRTPVPDDDIALRGHRLAEADGGGRVRQLQPDSTAPGVDHLLPADIPDGLEPQGRYVYVADAPDAGGVVVGRVVTIVDVFIGEGDLLVVENGGTTAGPPPIPEAEGIAADIPGAASARAFIRPNQNEVVLSPDGRRLVRLTSTLPLDQLQALASDLIPVDGTGSVTPLSDDLDITGRTAPEDMAAHDHGDGGVGEHTHDGDTHTHDG